jgi:hypothetical protein
MAIIVNRLIVDIESLFASDFNGTQQSVVKELSITFLENYKTSPVVSHHLFFPPKSLDESCFTDKVLASNTYLKHCRSGLSFRTGNCEYSVLFFILRNLVRNNEKYIVYAKGHEKLELIKKLFSLAVPNLVSDLDFINLEVLGCPKYTPNGRSYENCLPFYKNPKHKYCTVKKVKFYANWMISEKLLF